MRLKVVWQEHRLVVPVEENVNTVNELLEKISERFSRVLGRKVEFVRMKTSDQFEFDGLDLVQEVILGDEEVYVVDLDGWISDFKAKGTHKEWGYVCREDYEHETTRWARLAFESQHKQLYVELGAGEETLRLTLVDPETLSKERNVIDILVGDDWHAAACCSNSSGIELQVQATSDPQPEILHILINPCLTCGETKVIQQSHPSKMYILPGCEYSGPRISRNSIPRVPSLSPLHSEGDAALKLVQLAHPRFEQCWTSSSAKQLIYVDFNMENIKEHSFSVTEVNGEYLDHKSGKFISVPAKINKKGSVEKGQYMRATVTLELPIDHIQHYIPLDPHLQRIHAPSFLRNDSDSLPLRVSLTDSSNCLTAIDVLAYQAQPRLLTRDVYLASHPGIELLKWIQCDDAKTGERLSVPVLLRHPNEPQTNGFHAATNDYSLEYCCPSRTFSISRTLLCRWAWQASKNHTETYEIPGWTWSQGVYSVQVSAVVDLEDIRTFAMLFRMRTGTGLVVECVAVPKQLY